MEICMTELMEVSLLWRGVGGAFYKGVNQNDEQTAGNDISIRSFEEVQDYHSKRLYEVSRGLARDVFREG
jgi:hypothetical protein